MGARARGPSSWSPKSSLLPQVFAGALLTLAECRGVHEARLCSRLSAVAIIMARQAPSLFLSMFAVRA